MTEASKLLRKASQTLDAAQVLLQSGHSGDSVSRAYYAMFYAAQAALLSEGITPKSHKGVRVMFSDHFIKTGIFTLERGALPTQRA